MNDVDSTDPTGGAVRSAPGSRRAVVCSVADQAVSSLTNILAVVFAARATSADGFASFAIVYVVYSLLLGTSAAYIGQALVITRGDRADKVGAARSALSFVALASVALGLVLLLAVVAGDDIGRSFAALGVVLPVVLLQDAARYAFSLLRQAHLALACDLLWLAVLVPVLATRADGSSSAQLVLWWGLSAAPSLVLELALLWPQLRRARADLGRFLRRGYLGRRFVVEFASGNAFSQLSVLALGAVGTPTNVGALRGTTTLFGPMNVLFNAATGFGPPLLIGLERRAAKLRAVRLLAMALAAVAAVYAVALYLLPDSVGRQVLGDTWPAAHALVIAIGAQYVATAAGTVAQLMLRSTEPRATLPIQLVFSALAVVLMFAGYAAGGIQGAAWGLCAGSALKAIALWRRVLTQREEPTRPAPAAQLVPSAASPRAAAAGRSRR